MDRNLSINAYFQALAKEHRPKYRFAGKTKADWRRWRAGLLPRLLETLGRKPKPVPLNPEVVAEWREDGLIKQRVYIDVEKHLSATAYVFRPEGATCRLPAILACHGHGPFGKDAVMGFATDADRAASISKCNYAYGLALAKAGYAVIAIDWRGFGERNDHRKPHMSMIGGEGDLCNPHYLRAGILGMTVLGMNIHDGSRALDYLCQQKFVDPDRIGSIGLSYGGTMTVWMSIADERIKAADVVCYSDRFAYFGMREVNFCGSQVTPGLYDLCDMPDLQGLIAPRPLLVEIGTHDDCFLLDSAMSCQRELEKIYAAAGASDRLELDLFEGNHRWGANKTRQFFDKHLRPA